jgi:hypothetical protein
MSEQEIFTQSETILLNGFLVCRILRPTSLLSFAFTWREQRCVDEQELAITMITAAFFAKIENKSLAVRQAEHKSANQDDPFMVICKRQADFRRAILSSN